MAAVKVKLLVQRYPLSGTHCAGSQRSTSCVLCGGPPETLLHFVLLCPRLDGIRAQYMIKILDTLQIFHAHPESLEDLLSVVLDSSSLTWIPEDDRNGVEEMSRKMCFLLHNERSTILGNPSRFVAANRSVRMR